MGSSVYLIVDNNVAHLLVKSDDPDGAAIRTWILGYGRIVAGGGLLREYRHRSNQHEFVRYFNQLVGAGRVLLVDCADVDSASNALRANGGLRSNDHDIIGLALVSNARGLWSDDNALIDDFKDPAIINRPRGVVFHPNGSARRRRLGLAALDRTCLRG